MISFGTYLTEVKLATAFEAMIVCAYNGGPKKDPDVLEIARISEEQYYEHEKAALSIAKAIKTKCKPKGKAIHYGTSAGKLVDWWTGRSTPKTDFYIGDVHMSIKEASGSQLLSAMKGEAVSTFRAAIKYMDKESPEQALKLVTKISRVMQEVVVPPETTIGEFTKKVRAGDRVGKKLQPLADKFLSRDRAKTRLTKDITNFFNESVDFRDWFVFEAATGLMKFSPEGPKGLPIANWQLKFDASGKVHELERLMTARSKPTAYTRNMAAKVKFRISWKTPSSKGKKTFLSMRGDILKEQTLGDILEEARVEYQGILAESMLSTVGNWFRALYKKIMDTLARLAKNGIGAVLGFLGLEVSDIDVLGGLDLF